ncbi:RING finger protein, putative, partial [Ixodes scapularis]
PRLTTATWRPSWQLERLSLALDQCWQREPNVVVLYRWMGLLQDEALEHLQLETNHSLKPLVQDLAWLPSRPGERASRANPTRSRPSSGCHHSISPPVHRLSLVAVTSPVTRALRVALAEYNAQEKRRVFDSEWLTCQVCLTSKLGREFEPLVGCGHPFCRECLEQHFRIQVESGATLCCPQEGCTAQALPTQVKALVGEALGTRYEEHLLSQYLASQADLTYCPRLQCQQAVVTEPDLPMARCPSCHFVFCLYCRMVYHGVQPCRLKPGEQRAIRDQYLNGSAAEKRQMEKRYGRRTLQLVVDESLSQDWMQEHSKKCPHCAVSIEKQDGCNKMTCWRCGTYFCWLCAVPLKSATNPYQHFSDPNSPCFNKLFEGIQGAEDFDDNHELGEFLL